MNTSKTERYLTVYQQSSKLLDRLLVFVPDKVVWLRDELDYAWSCAEFNELLVVREKTRLFLEAVGEY